MARPTITDRLRHVLDAIETIERITVGRDFDEYVSNPEFRGAIERYVPLIAEACRHLPDALKGRRPDIPWRRIADVGNVIRHAYDQVDDRIIWDIAKNRLQPLKDAAEALLPSGEPE
jgi:uncharacterized protein with HEPN domain